MAPSRRAVLLSTAAALSPHPPAIGAPPLVQPSLSPRLGSAITASPSLFALGLPSKSGVLSYPQWMRGTWRVKSKIAAFSMPLGRAFADDFTLASAQLDIDREASYSYRMRFVDGACTSGGGNVCATQDRSFNAREETIAFLEDEGVKVESSRYTADAQAAPHGLVQLELLESGWEGGLSTITLDVQWCQWESLPNGAFVTDEIVQSTVRFNGEAGQAEISESTLTELITRFEPIRSNPAASLESVSKIRARNRIAQYLVAPGDRQAAGLTRKQQERAVQLAELAAGRAVTLFDYDWVLERLPDADDSSSGVEA